MGVWGLKIKNMAQKESNFTNMVLTLMVISLVSASALAFINKVTKEPIAKSVMAKKVEAIKQVVPEFNNDPIAEMQTIELADGKLEIYPAKKDGKLVGTAVKTFTDKGFSGHIELMIGLDTAKSIVNISVLQQKETPGLGTKMAEPLFKNQFNGKNPSSFKLKVKKDGGDVDAITAATISSRAFCDAIQKVYDNIQEGGKK